MSPFISKSISSSKQNNFFRNICSVIKNMNIFLTKYFSYICYLGFITLFDWENILNFIQYLDVFSSYYTLFKYTIIKFFFFLISWVLLIKKKNFKLCIKNKPKKLKVLSHDKNSVCML